MFYIPVEFSEETTLLQSRISKTKAAMACQLEFTGDFSGHFTLLIPRDLLLQVTQNFLGESSGQIGDEQLSGTLTEMLNMICGNALSKLYPRTPFELGIPKMVDVSEIPDTQLFMIIESTHSKMAINISVD
ncbi:MAG: chemotaxis protein CheX [Deltaproteobacteria bacterium]|nr:chemotaxis protein CheX [Deltaproteobacteria bacterium]